MKKLLYLITTIIAVFIMPSCSDSPDYEPAPAPNGAQIYFEIEMAPTLELETDQEFITIPVRRVVTEEESIILITNTLEDGADVFAIPTSITFAAGEAVTNLKIAVDWTAIKSDVPYDITLSIPDTENTTPYGDATCNFTVLYSPWTSLGNCTYTEDLLAGLFGFDNVTFPVEIEQSVVTPTKYRLKNPYIKGSAYYSLVDPTFADMAVTTDRYIMIDCANPNSVVLGPNPIGIMYDGGDIEASTLENGKFKDGIITFPTKGLLMTITAGADAGGYYANTKGKFRVVMPGVDVPSNVTVSYEGSYVDKTGKTGVSLGFTKDENAVSYKYAVVAGDISKDVAAIQAAADGIKNGSTTSIEKTESGIFTYGLTGEGKYTAVAVPFNDKGEAGNTGFAAFTFAAGGAPEPAMTFTLDVSNITVTTADVKITPSTSDTYFYDIQPKALCDNIGSDDDIIAALVDVYGEDFIGFLSEGEETGKIPNLDPSTEYYLLVFGYDADTNSATTGITKKAFTTLTPPAGGGSEAYKAWLGTWTLTSASSEITKAPVSYDIVFSEKIADASYNLSGWGITVLRTEPLVPVAKFTGETGGFAIANQQALNTQPDGTVIKLNARFFYTEADQYYLISGAFDALIGTMNADKTSAAVVGGGVQLEPTGPEYPVTGMDFFGYLGKEIYGYYADAEAGYIDDNYPVGPYTMTKKAALAPAVKISKSTKINAAALKRVPMKDASKAAIPTFGFGLKKTVGSTTKKFTPIPTFNNVKKQSYTGGLRSDVERYM